VANHKKIRLRESPPGHRIVCQYPVPQATVAIVVTFERDAANPFGFSYCTSQRGDLWKQIGRIDPTGGVERALNPTSGGIEEVRRTAVAILDAETPLRGLLFRVRTHTIGGNSRVEGDVWFLDRWDARTEHALQAGRFGEKPGFAGRKLDELVGGKNVNPEE